MIEGHLRFGSGTVAREICDFGTGKGSRIGQTLKSKFWAYRGVLGRPPSLGHAGATVAWEGCRVRAVKSYDIRADGKNNRSGMARACKTLRTLH